MSNLRVTNLKGRTAGSSPTLPDGVVITGVATATTFDGNFSGNAGGLSGTPNIVVGSVTGTTGSFSGNVSIGGTLTYEDVTNVDSVGIITARSGVDLNGTLREKVNITAGKLSDNLNIDLSNGMVHLFTTNETATAVPNIRVDGSTTLNSVMVIGESVVVTLITQANSAGYCPNLTINGGANRTINWIGGSAPSDGSSGVDIHSFTIIKTANDTFTIIGNQSKTA